MSQDLLAGKPNMEATYENQLHQQRNRDLLSQRTAELEGAEQNQNETAKNTAPAVKFPKGMFILALCFDVIGLIPVIDIASVVTEPIAVVIFGYWQKKYRNVDFLTILINAGVWKSLDAITIGILPSNSGLVIREYTKKKAGNLV